jgi:hypothetical protein
MIYSLSEKKQHLTRVPIVIAKILSVKGPGEEKLNMFVKLVINGFRLTG